MISSIGVSREPERRKLKYGLGGGRTLLNKYQWSTTTAHSQYCTQRELFYITTKLLCEFLQEHCYSCSSYCQHVSSLPSSVPDVNPKWVSSGNLMCKRIKCPITTTNNFWLALLKHVSVWAEMSVGKEREPALLFVWYHLRLVAASDEIKHWLFSVILIVTRSSH